MAIKTFYIRTKWNQRIREKYSCSHLFAFFVAVIFNMSWYSAIVVFYHQDLMSYLTWMPMTWMPLTWMPPGLMAFHLDTQNDDRRMNLLSFDIDSLHPYIDSLAAAWVFDCLQTNYELQLIPTQISIHCLDSTRCVSTSMIAVTLSNRLLAWLLRRLYFEEFSSVFQSVLCILRFPLVHNLFDLSIQN